MSEAPKSNSMSEAPKRLRRAIPCQRLRRAIYIRGSEEQIISEAPKSKSEATKGNYHVISPAWGPIDISYFPPRVDRSKYFGAPTYQIATACGPLEYIIISPAWGPIGPKYNPGPVPWYTNISTACGPIGLEYKTRACIMMHYLFLPRGDRSGPSRTRANTMVYNHPIGRPSVITKPSRYRSLYIYFNLLFQISLLIVMYHLCHNSRVSHTPSCATY